MLLVALAGIALTLSSGAAPGTDLPAWTFDADLEGWAPNAHLANVAVKNGVVSADARDWDPFFTRRDLAFGATPWQFVAVKIRASQPGDGDLFWSGTTEGEHGGFSQEKRASLSITEANTWEDVIIFPFWQAEGTIRQLRLDLYRGTHFDIDAIHVMEWGEDAAPLTDVFSWEFDGDAPAWQVHPAAGELVSPRLALPVDEKGWVSVRLQSDKAGTASILWGSSEARGMQTSFFEVRGAPEPKTYDIELQGEPGWQGAVNALGILLPKHEVRLEGIAIADNPLGPPEITTQYFGFANGVNRTGRTCRVIAKVENTGGDASEPVTARFVVSQDLRFSKNTAAAQQSPALKRGQSHVFAWDVTTVMPATHTVHLKVGDGPRETGKLVFTKPATQTRQAPYPAEPRPVGTAIDICAYYFPGWNCDAKWDCIREFPERKPVLGYYDESNPECVDWQIKWAVENGISCFLVDWYWCEGRQSLTHWFDAYRKAKFRDYLKVAIMWANHNPPGTHSPEDWRKVTQEWIGHYFNLPSYYRIGDKPAVFIWAPHNIRKDLNGSDAVKAALDESQEMARAAGYDGIHFVAMGYDFSATNIKALLHEGYAAVTTYHEWGFDNLRRGRQTQFAEVVRKSQAAWVKKADDAGDLSYYPVVDTGWDSRPWHGNQARVITGRTPQLFGKLLAKAQNFIVAHDESIIILGPVNEWGEGSYIEPCAEYGFRMLEAVRKAFGRGNPAGWPPNMGPPDIGRGPFDYARRKPVKAWDFDADPCGWTPMMNAPEAACSDGCLRFRTASADAALIAETYGIEALKFSKAAIKMQLVGPLPEAAHGQLFWSTSRNAMSEATSVAFPLAADGEVHEYTLDLASNPRWRGRVSSLRFDPCNAKDIEVALDNLQLR